MSRSVFVPRIRAACVAISLSMLAHQFQPMAAQAQGAMGSGSQSVVPCSMASSKASFSALGSSRISPEGASIVG